MYGVLRDRFKESKRDHRYCHVKFYKDITGANIALSLLAVVWSVASHLVLNFSCTAHGGTSSVCSYSGNDFQLFLTFLPVLVMLMYLAINVVDNLIEFYSKKITDNDVAIGNFIGKKVFGKNHEGFDDGYSYFIFIVANVGIVWGIWFTVMWPTLVWVWILFGGHYALVKLANLVYRTSKGLRNHVNDPDAHKKD